MLTRSSSGTALGEDEFHSRELSGVDLETDLLILGYLGQLLGRGDGLFHPTQLIDETQFESVLTHPRAATTDTVDLLPPPPDGFPELPIGFAEPPLLGTNLRPQHDARL